MVQKIIVLGKNKSYSFTDEKTGQVFEGQKIWYISDSKTDFGYVPIQSNLSLELASKVDKFPAIYEVSYSAVAGKNNKLELVPSDFKFISNVEFKF